MKKTLVIDGNSILNRAFYGVRPLTTRTGKCTNAIFGMINIIFRQMDAVKPDYAAVAFDLHAPNFRKKVYDAYKAGRHETPPDLLSQFDDAKECLRLLGLHVLEKEGYEADDILGTVARMTEDEDAHAYVLSGDRDLLQLISDKTTVLLAANSDTLVFNRNEFFEKYGVEPSAFVDMKAIMGDSSDNIPGVAGIGEKGAQKLISAFGSLDGVYESIDSPDIAKGMREKLMASKENAYLSRFLATIETHVPLDIPLESLAYTGIRDGGALYKKLAELEFTAFIRKFGVSPADAEKEAAKEHNSLPTPVYEEADAFSLPSLLPESFGVEMQDGALYFSAENQHFVCRDALMLLQHLFDGSHTVVCYDAKSLYHALLPYGITLSGVPEDLMLFSYLLNPQNVAPSTSALAESILGVTADNAVTSHLLLPLREKMREMIAAAGCEKLLYEVELPLSLVLARMEKNGFCVDREKLVAFGERLKKKISLSEEKLALLAGEGFNPNSPKQLGELLFEKLGLPAKKKTKSGYSTDAETLSALRFHHPIVNEILEYRQLSKLYSTYAVGLEKVIDENGRIHTDFKQALTATGRLSSAEPNLQNIPVRTPLGREIRGYFKASDKSRVLVDADYSQIELRLLAAIAGDETMIRGFKSGADIHRSTAATVFGVPESEVTDDQRKSAKAINFGIVYGIGAYSLSEDLKTSVAEAQGYIKSYLASYPAVAAYLDAVVKDAEEKGYTETLFGRRRYIPELRVQNHNVKAFGKRVAMNAPIQGTAADIMKIAMVRTENRLKREGLSADLVMQVHDELIVECERVDAERVAAILKEEMEGAANLPVPLTVEVSIGDTWLCKA